MEISERRMKILKLAVEEYIKDKSPITSSNVKDLGNIDFSTATLRNELNTLEAMGFLRQVHISGGRVPTAKAYRFYVENMLGEIDATESELNQVQQIIENRTNSLNDLVSSIAKVVSQATNYPTVVVLNGLDNLILKDFRLMPLIDGKVLVLIGTNAGYINDTISIQTTEESCKDASAYLTQHFSGESIGFMIENISSIKQGVKQDLVSFYEIIDGLVTGLKKINQTKMLDIRKGNTIKMVESKEDLQDVKQVIDFLEDEGELIKEVDEKLTGINIKVANDDGSNCSMIKAPVSFGGNQLATISVLGPQRMDYEKIASALKVLTENLANLKGD